MRHAKIFPQRLELFKDRTVPSGSEWLLRLDHLSGSTPDEQIAAAQALIDAAQIEDLSIEAVDHTGLDGNIVIEVPGVVPAEVLNHDLRVLPGFVSVDPFEDESVADSALTQAPDGTGPVQLDPSPAGGPNLNVGLVGNEPTIAVNPSNPNNVVVAQFNNGSQTMRISLDGGATFPISRNAVLPSGQTFFAGDDSLAFDAAGRLFWTYLSGPSINVVSLQINPTTGAVIGSPSFVATGNLDKEWLAADRNPASPFANNLYSVWNDFNQLNAPIRFSRSTDQGATWTTIPGNMSGASEGFTWPSEVTVAPNGDVWAAWHTNTIGTGSNGEIRMRRSTDGGLTFGPEIIPFPAGTADAQVNAGSAEYGPPVPPRINQLKSWLQGSLQPRILVDPARPGNMYVISVDDPDNVYDAAGDPSDIVMARSTDGGATWTRSTISHGAPGTIQIMPAAAIDAAGNISVTWYDTRGGATNAGGDFLLDVYTTSSFDGGLTFSADSRINDVSFNPDLGAPDRFGNQTFRIGEYNGLASAAGSVYAVWTGNTGTGQQVVFTKFTLGFSVVGSIPAQGQVVTTAPNDFVIQLAGAVAPGSVQASDLTVNGIAADSFIINGAGDAITFHYITSPVTTQGLQSMAVAAGAMVRLSDSSPVLAFSATFHYDAVPLTVTSTTPSFPGGVFTLPGPFTYDVTFNEAFDPASLQATDLVITGFPGASVTGVTALPGNTTARFTIGGISIEGALTASIAAGSVVDAFGNPGVAFSAAYQVDYGTVPYPTPLTSKPPLGSLIYDPSIAGTINFPGDTDSFTLNVDAGQTITVLVDPAGSPDPSLYGGVGNGAGSAAGQLLLINQTTGISSTVGDPVTPGGLTGLVYDPSAGVFLGSTINGGVSTLVRINPDTGALISVVGTITNGSGGPTISIGDLAIQPGTNVLFGVTSNSGAAGGLLYTINKATGVATFVGNTGAGAGGGLSFAPDGSLYQTSFNNFFDFTSLNQIDPATAARISTVAVPGYYDGLGIRPSDGVFFAADGGSSTAIYTLNPTTGAATLVGNTSASTSDLAFRPPFGVAPTVELRSPTNALLGSASAGPALNALLQTIPAAAAGTYKITVGDGGGNTGSYTVQVILNAALESETVGGPTDDTITTAQNIDGSFINLSTGPAQRGAVLGHDNGKSLYGVDRFSNLLTEYDPGSGAVRSSKPMTVNGNSVTAAFGLAIDPTTSVLYALLSYPGVNTALVTLDPATGVGSFIADVGSAGQHFTDITFSSTGQLYGLTGDGGANAASLFALDKATGARTFLLALTNFGGATGESLAFNSDTGLLYRFQAGTFESIDPVSLVESTIPTTGSNPYYSQAMIYVGNGLFFLVSFDSLYSITTGGALSFITSLPSASSRTHGLALIGNGADLFSFTLLAGHSATLALSGPGSTVELLDGSGTVLATGSPAANLSGVIANFHAATSGLYYARVTRLLPGDYNLVVTRDAAFDTEGNDTFAAAQTISGVQGVLGSLGGGSGNTLTLNWVDSGWWNSPGNHDSSNKNYFDGQGGGDQYRDYFVFDLSGVSQTITAATLRLYNPSASLDSGNGYVSPDPTETYSLFDVSTPISTLGSSGSGQTTIFDDLGTGTSFGSQTVSAADNGNIVAVSLNADALAALNAARGGAMALGGAVTTIVGPNDQAIFAYTGFGPNVANHVRQLVVDLGAAEDWYSVDVSSLASALRLETSTPADGAGEFVNTLNPHIELYDPSGTLVASGTALGDGRNEFIQYVPLVTGTYRIRITAEGDTTGEYFLSKNFSPIVASLGVNSPINENGTATVTGTISDPDALDTHTVVITWGAGEGSTTLTLAAGVTTFSATHQYLDDNPTGTPSDVYLIGATVTDNQGGTGTGGTSVTVNNVAPAVAPISGPSLAVRGQPLSFSANFTDVGTHDTHTAVINWGDGTSPGTVSEVNGSGSVTGGHVYVSSGTYTVTFTVTDDDTGTTTVTRQVTVVAAALLPDPLNPGQFALYVGGTTSDDEIEIDQECHGRYEVEIETGRHEWEGTFSGPISRVVVYAQAGDDEVEVDDSISVPSWLYGGAGDDHLEGGRGFNVLLGGDGNDNLIDGSGRGILIGGRGSDRLVGGGADDLLIGGTTTFDDNEIALNGIALEWGSSRSYADRVANLRGTGSGPRLNGSFFLTDSTVLDDGVQDKLTGSSGQDWFWAFGPDKITDKKGNENND